MTPKSSDPKVCPVCWARLGIDQCDYRKHARARLDRARRLPTL